MQPLALSRSAVALKQEGPIPVTTPDPTFSRPPVRGTQSLVGVMSFVWKRPALTGLELLWRWLAVLPLLWLAWHALAVRVAAITLDTRALATMTVFEPVHSVAILASALGPYLPVVRRTAAWWAPLAFCVWALLSAWGRTVVLRRADSSLRRRFTTMLLFRSLRAFSFLLLLLLWISGILAALRATILHPSQGGAEPNLVLFTAEAVALTLAAFMLWSLTAWLLDLPPLLAMTGLSLDRPGLRHLRAKLIETNLVMGIVRVALFVLAMTFSASPLPFQTQETQAYINVWWIGVAVFYVVSSDFFHVVRLVTYLRLLQTLSEGNNVRGANAS